MARFKVVHVDPMGRRMDIETEELARIDAELVAERCTTDDEAVALAHDADALLNTIYPISRALLERCDRLKVVVRYGVGYDNVDLDAATERGVIVCNVPDYCIDEVANHTMALLLALNRRIVQQDAGLRSGERVALSPMGKLRDEVLGLVGYGRLARAVATRARAFGMRIAAHDPFVADDPGDGTELLSLDDLLATADYVSVHTPLTEETRGLIDARALALMKSTAYLVSTARGGIVSEAALLDALEAGTLAGAGLDVWEKEPVASDHPLLRHPSVVATPHTAYFSNASAVEIRRRVAAIAADVLTGGIPASVVNPAVLDRLGAR